MTDNESGSKETGDMVLADGVVDEDWQGQTLEEEVENGDMDQETYNKISKYQNQQGIMKITPVTQMQTYVRSTVSYIAEGVEYAQIQMFPICDVNVNPHQISFDFYETTEGKIGVSNATEKHMIVECDVYVTDLIYFYWNHGNTSGSDFSSMDVRTKQDKALVNLIERICDSSDENDSNIDSKTQSALNSAKQSFQDGIIELGNTGNSILDEEEEFDPNKSYVFEVKFDDDWKKVNYENYKNYKEAGYPTRVNGGVNADVYAVYPETFEIQEDNGDWKTVTYQEYFNEVKNNNKNGRINGGSDDINQDYWQSEHTFQMKNDKGEWINVPYESYVHAVRDGKEHRIDNAHASIEDASGQFEVYGNTYDKQKAKENAEKSKPYENAEKSQNKVGTDLSKGDIDSYLNNFEDSQEFIEFRQTFLQQHSGWLCTFTSSVFGTFDGVLTEVRYEIPSGETSAKFHLKIEEAIFTTDYSAYGVKDYYGESSDSSTSSDVSSDGSTDNSGSI